METVYIIGIIVAGLVTMVIVLRDRITGFLASGEVKRGEIEAKGKTELQAASPKRRSSKKNSETERGYSVDISGNTNLLGNTIFRIFRSGVRIAKNTNILGGSNVEVSGESNATDALPQPEVSELQSRLEGSEPKQLLANEAELKRLPESERQHDIEKDV